MIKQMIKQFCNMKNLMFSVLLLSGAGFIFSVYIHLISLLSSSVAETNYLPIMVFGVILCSIPSVIGMCEMTPVFNVGKDFKIQKMFKVLPAILKGIIFMVGTYAILFEPIYSSIISKILKSNSSYIAIKVHSPFIALFYLLFLSTSYLYIFIYKPTSK